MEDAGDLFNLSRFLEAQERDFETACEELRGGRKLSHWIWYVFPQLGALGRSPTARFYGIGSLEEARAYIAHPILGHRIDEAAEAALASGESDARRLLGTVDALKLRSCLTLFIVADPGRRVLHEALERFYDGLPDEATLMRVGVDSVGFGKLGG